MLVLALCPVVVVTHRRSVAKRGGCFQRRLFVCQCVSVFVRTITSERLNVGRSNWRLGTLYNNLAVIRMSRSKVKGHGHQGQKKRKLLSHISPLTMHSRACVVGRTQQAATDDTTAWPPGVDGLRRWENQRCCLCLLYTSPSPRD